MTITTGDIFGHAQVGVYLSVVGDILFHPRALDDATVEELASSFDMEMYPFLVGGSSLLGSLLRGNSRGIAVADIAAPIQITAAAPSETTSSNSRILAAK